MLPEGNNNRCIMAKQPPWMMRDTKRHKTKITDYNTDVRRQGKVRRRVSRPGISLGVPSGALGDTWTICVVMSLPW